MGAADTVRARPTTMAVVFLKTTMPTGLNECKGISQERVSFFSFCRWVSSF